MTKIDRYLLFLYLRVFVICFLTLAGLLVVVQVFTNLDELIAFGKTRGGFIYGLIAYFSPSLLSIYDQMCGLLTLIATMFVVAWLYRTNEMTALLAAGISKGRIITPILAASALLILGAAVSRELLIPHYSAMLSKTPQELLGESTRQIRPTEDVEQGVLIAGQTLLPAKLAIRQPFFKFLGPASQVTSQVIGSLAQFLPADVTHPAGYLVSDARGADNLLSKPSVKTDKGIFLFLPSDTPWLKANECFVPSKLEFDVLRGGVAKQFASTGDLIWRMRNQPQHYGDPIKVAVHARFLQPFMDFTQLLLGLPLILSNRNRNLIGMLIGCVATFAMFFGVSIGLHTLGSTGTLLTPATAAWTPLLIFGPVAWAQTRRAMLS